MSNPNTEEVQPRTTFTTNELRNISVKAMGRASEAGSEPVYKLGLAANIVVRKPNNRGKYIKKIIFSGLLFFIIFCYAKDTKICSEIDRDRERGECIYAQYKEADVSLNNAYKELKGIFNTENKEYLKKAQLAWLNYRDLDCQLESAPFSGGTLFDEVGDKCLMEKTKLRTKELIRLKDVWDM